MIRAGLGGLLLAGLGATAVQAESLWQEVKLADADKILECAAILDLLEVPEDSLEDWPEGMVIDFPAASQAMRARVQVFHGEAYIVRRFEAHRAYWEAATPQDPKVAGLEAFLEACRVYGTTHGLPM